MRGYAKKRRKRVLIDGLQYRMLTFNFVYLIMVILVFSATALGPLILKLENDSLSWDEKAEAANQLLALHVRIWPPIAVMCVLLAAHSILVSHRIAGPLYRFRQIFGAIGKGDLSVRVKIRTRDYLRKEADSISDMIGGVSARIQKIHDGYREARAALGYLELALDKGNMQEATLAAAEVGKEIDQLAESIKQFKMPSEHERDPASKSLPAESTVSV